MEDPIEIRFRWTLEELTAAYRLQRRPKLPVLWFCGGALCLLVLFGVYTSISSEGFFRQSPWVIANALFPVWFCPLLVIVMNRWFLPWMMRNLFARHPDRNAELIWLIEPDIIRISSPLGKSEFSWAMISRVLASGEGFLMYSSPQHFQWLPRHGFANTRGFERFAELARQKVKTFRRLK